jgi:tetratricopeptide (TPR) repeat protein
MDEQQVLAALDAAVHGRLLRDEGIGGAYAFTHDLIRETIVADLGSARRAVLHRAVAEELERLPERQRQAAEVVWHFQEAGEPARALPHALAAGDQAEAVYAHAEAEQHYRTALELAQEAGDRKREAEAWEKLGNALKWQGHHDEALALLGRALAAAQARQDGVAVVRIAVPLTKPYVDSGRSHEGIARLELIRQGLALHGSAGELAVIDLALTHLYYGTGQYAEGLAAAERALEAAEALGDPAQLAHALWRRGAARLLLARLRESLPDLEAAAELAAQTGLPAGVVWSWHCVAIAHLHLGKLDDALRAQMRALEAAEPLGVPDFTAAQLSFAARLAFEHGDWPAAHDFTARAEHMLPNLSAGWAAAMVLEEQGHLALVAGDRETARHLLEKALVRAEDSGDLQCVRRVQQLLAEHDLHVGDPAAAAARLMPLLDRPGLVETDVNSLLPVLARAQLELGESERTASLIAQTCERLRTQADRHTLTDALCVMALGHLEQGRWDDASHALDEALAHTHAIPSPYAEIRVLYGYGQLYSARGESERAREHYTAALALCARLGEGMYRPSIERALAEL